VKCMLDNELFFYLILIVEVSHVTYIDGRLPLCFQLLNPVLRINSSSIAI
jgi:hypothetical protein